MMIDSIHTQPRRLTLGVFLKSCIFNLLMILLTIFFSLTALLIFWAPYAVRYRYITTWSKSIIKLASIVCGVHYKIEGLEHLPQKNAIILCNHQSTWETLFLQTLLPSQSWVLKRELLWIPFFGWGLSLLEPIAINRNKKNSLKFLIKMGKKRLKQGRWVVIFPEGTRLKPGQQGKFSRSGEALAQASGYPVIPMAHNAGCMWPKNSFFKYSGTIRVKIGPAFDPKNESSETLTQQLQSWIYTQSD